MRIGDWIFDHGDWLWYAFAVIYILVLAAIGSLIWAFFQIIGGA